MVPSPVPTRRDESIVDLWHGTAVPDPYAWLEDPDSPETAAWVAAQNRATEAWLAQIPARAEIAARLAALTDHPRQGLPVRRGDSTFYEINPGLANQNCLVVEVAGAPARTLLDANGFSEDGTVGLMEWVPSDDGRFVVYGVSDGGSDWRIYRVRTVATGEDFPEAIRWAKFTTPAWSPDHRGFWYARFAAPTPGAVESRLMNQQVWYHRLGTPQSDDVLVHERPDHPLWGFHVAPTDDGQWLILSISQGTEERSRVHYRALATPEAPFLRLLDAFDAQYTFLDAVGRTFLFLTDKDAPNGRVIAVDLDDPAPAAWRTVVPESEDAIEAVTVVGERLIVNLLRHAHTHVLVYTLAGALVGAVPLPGIGTATGFSGRRADTETTLAFTSFVRPTELWTLDLRPEAGLALTPRFLPELGFDREQYTTEQVFVPSPDGTPVPLFLTYRRDLPRDGERPTLLYGYGGFNIPVLPAFAASTLVWLERGGVYASANLRGGGEYGRAWHEAGTLLQKQNVFDDFAACAAWLADESGWTRAARIGISGRSNGGLLVGATLVQHPELIGAAIPAVGVLDLLKYHAWTIGWAWASDYGLATDPEMFPYLLNYSPYHNCEPRAYPATLVCTADHDDRVVPAHSFKFAAALQHAQRGSPPILARIETRAGHGVGKSVEMVIAERADQLAFLVRALGVG